MNLLEKEAAHQRAKYLKYKKLNKSFAKKNTRVILYDPLDIDSSSSSESQNSCDEDSKTYIDYNLKWCNNEESSNRSIVSKEQF